MLTKIITHKKDPVNSLEGFFTGKNKIELGKQDDGLQVVIFNIKDSSTAPGGLNPRITNHKIIPQTIIEKIIKTISKNDFAQIVKKNWLFDSKHDYFNQIGINIRSVSKEFDEFKQDLQSLSKVDILLIDRLTLRRYNKQITFFKNKFNFMIIAIENPHQMICDRKFPDRENKDVAKGDIYDELIEYAVNNTDFAIQTKKNWDKYSNKLLQNKLYDYLQKIFPQLPPEILEGLLNKISSDFSKLNSITSKTLSGVVGRIYFQTNNKDYIFKIYDSDKKGIAQVEFEVGKKIASDKDLSMVCAKTIYTKDQEGPLTYGNYFMILTEDVSKKVYQRSFLEQQLIVHLEANSDQYILHKIYVIALIHSRLKLLIKEEKLETYVIRKDFFPWKQLEEDILKINPSFKTYLPNIEKIYHDVVNKHSTFEKDVIAHNDPKEDNFVNGYLIDYGSVHAGTPYVDLARILLFVAYKEQFSLDKYIAAYIFFRGHLDNSFSYEQEIKHADDNIFINTYERIFSESLRIARYKSIIGEKKIADFFLSVTIIMANKISSSYYKIALEQIKKGIFSKLDNLSAEVFLDNLKNKVFWH